MEAPLREGIGTCLCGSILKHLRFEFKKSIALEYLNGNGGYGYLISQYNLGTN